MRYGLRPSFIDNKLAQANLKNAPTGLTTTETHWLETLRQGYVYIYAPNGHKGSKKQDDRTASDAKGKWMVFRYSTDNEDKSSIAHYPQIDLTASQGNYSFVRYDFVKEDEGWVLGDATNKWRKANNEPVYDTPFIHNETSQCYVAYSEYPWTQALFEKIESDKAIRDSLMTAVNPVPKDNTTEKPEYQPQAQVGLLKDIGNAVVNFTMTTKGAKIPEEITSVQQLRLLNQWRYSEIRILSANFCQQDLDTGLFVALTDTLGEIQELALYQGIFAEHYEKYKAEYTYPMTIGEIIHPKLMYDLRKLKYPHKEETLYEKYPKTLDKNFLGENGKSGEYGRIASHAIIFYEKPLKDIVNARKQLKERKSFLSLLDVLSQAVADTSAQASSSNTPAQKCLSASIFFSKVSDALKNLECSPEGEQLINSTQGIVAPNSSFNLTGWADYIKAVIDGMLKITNNITGNRFQSSELSPYYRAMELYFYSAGKTMVKSWMMNVEGSKDLAIDRDKLFRIYDVDSAGRTPEVWLQAFIQALKDEENANMKNRHIKRNPRRRHLEKLEKLLEKKQETGKDAIKEAQQAHSEQNHLRQARLARLDLFVGVLGTYTALMSLNADNALQRKLAQTAEGKLANEPIIVKTAAIIDIALFTWDKSPVYMPNKIKLPTEQVGKLSPLGNRVAAYGVMGLNIIAGVAAMIIAHGGMKEAEASGDDLAYWSYRAMFWSGAVSTVGGIASFAEISSALVATALSAVLLMAFIIALIAGAILFFFVDSDIEKWLKHCFWGKSADYLYWGQKKREDLRDLLAKAKLFSKQTNKLSEADKKMQSIISKGFTDELYDIGILSGLKIKVNEKTGKVTLHCAEFTRTEPTLTNLVVKVDFFQKASPTEKISYGQDEFLYPSRPSDNYKATLITDLTRTGQIVSFQLDEKIKKNKNYAIYATFTDAENEVLKDHYETIDYVLAHMDMD